MHILYVYSIRHSNYVHALLIMARSHFYHGALAASELSVPSGHIRRMYLNVSVIKRPPQIPP